MASIPLSVYHEIKLRTILSSIVPAAGSLLITDAIFVLPKPVRQVMNSEATLCPASDSLVLRII